MQILANEAMEAPDSIVRGLRLGEKCFGGDQIYICVV